MRHIAIEEALDDKVVDQLKKLAMNKSSRPTAIDLNN